MQIEIEYFDVLHTKHLHQKSKVWEDGFLEYHVVPQKLVLYANNTRMSMLDAKFSKTVPDLSPGEEIRFTKYIVQIERRRLEGRSTVKREN